MAIDPTTVLAVIPARGGSIGIPRKNVQRVAGAPLVARTVKQALRATLVGRVVVTTEDDEIAAIACNAGAEIVRRPQELSGATASSESAVIHVLEQLANVEGWQPEIVVLLQCTSPLTDAADIDGVVRTLERDGADCALTVARVHQFLWKRTADGIAGVNHDPAARLRRQEREPEFVETGAAYVMRVGPFLRARHRFFGKIAMHETPRRRWLEIDEPDDLLFADVVARLERSDVSALPPRIDAVVFDFDGVFTDNRVFVLDDGREAVRCDRSDGLGISMLRSTNMPILVLSSERSPVVRARCEKLAIECQHGIVDKLSALREWATERSVSLTSVVYVGNDRNDVGCLEAVGCGVVVADAHPAARAVAQIVLSRPGGRGAVREICDLVLRSLETES